MKYVLTLNNIYVSDVNKAGYRAVDLATLARRSFKIPLCFVLTTEALEEFVESNNLKEKGGEFLAAGNYEAFQQAVLQGKIPEQVMTEIMEAYETLNINKASDASQLVDAAQKPFVNVIPSPNYLLPKESFSGLTQNITGITNVINAIKKAWADLFSAEHFQIREKKNLREFFSGIIIQQTPDSSASGMATATESPNIIVQTWFGFPDFGGKDGKDYFEISKEYLRIEKQEVKNQLNRLTRNEHGQLQSFPLEDRGSKQKVDDKIAMEMARLCKRVQGQLEQSLKVYFTIHGEIYILFADRLEDRPATVTPMAAPKPEPTTDSVPDAPDIDMPTPDMDIPSPGTAVPSEPLEKKVHKVPKETVPMAPTSDTSGMPSAPMPDVKAKDDGTNEDESDDNSENFLLELERAQAAIESGPLQTRRAERKARIPDDESMPDPEKPVHDDLPSPWKERVDALDHRIQHVNDLKSMIDELHALIEAGNDKEVHHKLNELDEAILNLRRKS